VSGVIATMRALAAGLTFAGLSGAVYPHDIPKPLRFILLTPFADYSFFEPIKKGMSDAARSLGVEATFSGTPDGNVKALAGKVREAVKAGYDGIGLNIVDPVALDAVVAEAVGNGVPVIAFNVDDNKTPNARLAAIGQNMPQAGRIFGRAVASSIPEGSHVLLTMHDPNISALEDRAAGAQEVLKSKEITWTPLLTGTEPNAALERIRMALEANPSIRVILSTGSADTEAAGKVIEKYFRGKDYFCAGFDLSPEILRLIKANIIRLSIDQHPYAQGYYAMVELTLYRRYGIQPSFIDTGAAVITADEVDQIVKLSQEHYR
jgi:simple sugar transport system substrate-binding protein